MNEKNPTVETFELHDLPSIAALHKARKGEEISPQSYLAFTIALLKQCGGFISQDELEREVMKHYGNAFGPEDKRLMRVGKTKARIPKWKNNLAWGKVLGKKDGMLRQRRSGKTTIIVLLANDLEHAEWVRWVCSGKRSRISMKKRCAVCKTWNGLGNEVCDQCGGVFPKPNERVHKLPR